MWPAAGGWIILNLSESFTVPSALCKPLATCRTAPVCSRLFSPHCRASLHTEAAPGMELVTAGKECSIAQERRCVYWVRTGGSFHGQRAERESSSRAAGNVQGHPSVPCILQLSRAFKNFYSQSPSWIPDKNWRADSIKLPSDFTQAVVNMPHPQY